MVKQIFRGDILCAGPNWHRVPVQFYKYLSKFHFTQLPFILNYSEIENGQQQYPLFVFERIRP
jgi:hypothetical protein